MKKLSSKGQKWLKSLHIYSGCVWVGCATTLTTSLYVLMGRMEDAKHEANEVMRLHPDFSLESFAKTVTLKCQPVVIDMMETLRKAGLK